MSDFHGESGFPNAGAAEQSDDRHLWVNEGLPDLGKEKFFSWGDLPSQGQVVGSHRHVPLSGPSNVPRLDLF